MKKPPVKCTSLSGTGKNLTYIIAEERRKVNEREMFMLELRQRNHR